MSSEPKWAQVCSSEEAVSVDPATYCRGGQAENASPIDEFYTYLTEVLPLGTEESLRNNRTLGRVLLLGLVSGVELYFRSIIARTITVCPIARDHASRHVLSLAALDYYGLSQVGLGLLEGVSFSTEGEVERQTERMLGIKWLKTTSLASATRSFEVICHLRHAAVHSRGELSSGNLRSLGLRDRQSRRSLFIELPQLHEAAVICQSTVRAYNRYVYRQSVERWIAQGLLSGTWKKDGKNFKPLYDSFYSKKDGSGSPKAFQSHRNLHPIIVARAGVPV